MHDGLRLPWLWLGIGLVGCAAVLYGCLIPGSSQPVGLTIFDKILHFLAFLGLGMWFAGILPSRCLQVFVVLLAFGLAIEVLQSMTTYRNGDILDFLADAAGTAAGIGLARIGAMRWLEVVDRHAVPNRNNL